LRRDRQSGNAPKTSSGPVGRWMTARQSAAAPDLVLDNGTF
jgi:hypothetical protein